MPRSAAVLFLASLSLAPLAGAEVHEVKMLNRGAEGAMVYEPDHLRLAPGDTLRFVPTHASHNAATLPALLPAGATAFKGPLNQPAEYTFDVPGLYAIQCLPHVGMGMVMLVQVGDVDLRTVRLPSELPARARARLEAQRAKLQAGQ